MADEKDTAGSVGRRKTVHIGVAKSNEGWRSLGTGSGVGASIVSGTGAASRAGSAEAIGASTSAGTGVATAAASAAVGAGMVVATPGEISPPAGQLSVRGHPPEVKVTRRRRARTKTLKADSSSVQQQPQIVRRILEDPANIRDAARALHDEVAKQIDELKRTRPNDERLAQYDDLIGFLEGLAAGLAELSDAIDRLLANTVGGKPEPVLLGKAAEIAHQLNLGAVEWLEEHRTAVIDVPIRIGLFGLGMVFLHALGVEGHAVTAAVAYFAGKRGTAKKPSKKPHTQS